MGAAAEVGNMCSAGLTCRQELQVAKSICSAISRGEADSFRRLLSAEERVPACSECI